MRTRIALFGGSFDPVHHGHLIVARSVGEQVDAERVVFLPSALPPHKRDQRMTSPQDRAEMVRLAIADEPLFDFNEYDLAREGPSYTVETIEHFRKELGGDAEILWIIGADSLPDLPQWYRSAELVDLCRIVIAHRPGWEKLDFEALTGTFTDDQVAALRANVVEAPRIGISATDIRRRVRTDRSIRYLVPDAVRAYVERRRLYRE